MDPKVIFTNDDFLVVEKPAGMVVNRADTIKTATTLQDWVEKNFPQELVSHDTDKYVVNGYNKHDEFVSRSGIVHRLDKETSGIILVARNVETFINLQEQFKNGTVKKTYKTLVHGKVEPETGEINEPIGRLPWNRTRFGILPEGREALSRYKVIDLRQYKNEKESEILSLVEVYPQTGRTHQIRVHFQHIKHPVFGDELYAGRKQGRSDRRHLERHFLHASKISLKDPKTNEPIEFESELPEALLTFLNSLAHYENKD